MQTANSAKILGGAAASDFWQTVGNIGYYHGQPNSPGSGRTQNDIVNNGDYRTLAKTVPYDVARVLTNNGHFVKAVVLGRDFYNDQTISQADTLLHEALHISLDMGEAQLKTYLSNLRFASKQTDSHDITEWLQQNCPEERK